MLWPQESLGSPFTLGCMLEVAVLRGLSGQAMAWLTGVRGPHTPLLQPMACVLPPLAASPFCVCLLWEHELSAGPWEGGTPGFPQAGC